MIEATVPFIAYVIALAVAAAIPGPGVAAVVGRALACGSRSSRLFILGLAFGNVLFLTVAVLGLAGLAAAASGVFMGVRLTFG